VLAAPLVLKEIAIRAEHQDQALNAFVQLPKRINSKPTIEDEAVEISDKVPLSF